MAPPRDSREAWVVFHRVVVGVAAAQIGLAIYRATQGERPERSEWVVLTVIAVVGIAAFGALVWLAGDRKQDDD